MDVREVPVSAVIPCYRCAGSIRRAVLSVHSQTRRPVELILVDDASGDGTLSALKNLCIELGPAWARVLELPENRGAATARNAGWEAARGEFVAFLDADDSWLPNKLERQVAFMREHPEFAVSGHLARYGEPGPEDFRVSERPPSHREISRLGVLLRNPMVTPSLMVRRHGSIRFDDGRRHMEDQRFIQKLVFANARVTRMEEKLAVVHKAAFGEGGLSAGLWAMERAELDNYAALNREGKIGRPTLALLSAYSLAKYARRVAVTGLRRMLG